MVFDLRADRVADRFPFGRKAGREADDFLPLSDFQRFRRLV